VRYCNPTYDWAGTGDFLAGVSPGAADLATGGGWRGGLYTGAAASVTNVWGTVKTHDVPYPAATGMLAEVVPKGARTLASTCYWKNADVQVTAPKNGAAALFASVSALAFGAAVLAI